MRDSFEMIKDEKEQQRKKATSDRLLYYMLHKRKREREHRFDYSEMHAALLYDNDKYTRMMTNIETNRRTSYVYIFVYNITLHNN